MNSTYELRDRETNRCRVMSVEEMKRDYQARSNSYTIVDNKFADNKFPHPTTDESRREMLRALGDFALCATMHIPDCVVLFCHSTDSVTLYREDDLFVLGHVSVERTRESEYKKFNYNVTSHTIQNNRYCPHNSPTEFRTLSSIKWDKALSNARQYLRGNTLEDIGRATVAKVSYAFSGLCDKYKDEANKALRALGIEKTIYNKYSDHDDPPILKEMLRVAELGMHVFLDPDVNENMTTYYKSHSIMRNIAQQHKMTLCHVYTNHRGVEWCESHDVNVDNVFSNEFGDDFCRSHATRAAEMVDSDLQASLAALAIVEDGTFVEGLGYKFNDNIYYVTKPDQTDS
jgi:hypothetical protein